MDFGRIRVRVMIRVRVRVRVRPTVRIILAENLKFSRLCFFGGVQG